MAVRQVMPNLPCRDPAASAAFWKAVLGFDTDIDRGFLTYLKHGETSQRTRLAVVAEERATLPVVSFEVDDLDDTLARAVAAGAEITYGPATEIYAMRRFFMRDPDGNLVSIVQF